MATKKAQAPKKKKKVSKYHERFKAPKGMTFDKIVAIAARKR